MLGHKKSLITQFSYGYGTRSTRVPGLRSRNNGRRTEEPYSVAAFPFCSSFLEKEMGGL